jgi:hypothetical protein
MASTSVIRTILKCTFTGYIAMAISLSVLKIYNIIRRHVYVRVYKRSTLQLQMKLI